LAQSVGSVLRRGDDDGVKANQERVESISFAETVVFLLISGSADATIARNHFVRKPSGPMTVVMILQLLVHSEDINVECLVFYGTEATALVHFDHGGIARTKALNVDSQA